MNRLDHVLSDSLKACAEAFRPSGTLDARDRFARRLRRRRATQAAGALVAAGVAAVLVLAIARPGGVERKSLPAASRPVIAETFSVGDGPRGPVAALGGIWVANGSGGTLTRVDIASGETRSIRPLRGVDSSPVAVTSWRGFLFFTDAASGMLVPADPRTGSVPTQSPVGPDPGDVVATSAGVWVASSDTSGAGAVWLSAPSSEEEGSDAPEIPTVARFAERPELAVDAGVVWASSQGLVLGLRIEDGGVVRGNMIEVPGAGDIAARSGIVWAVTDSGEVVRIDADAGSVTARADLGLPPGSRIASTEAALWVVGGTGERGEIVRLDAASLEVLGRRSLRGGPFAVTTADGAAWVTDAAGDVLLRVEPAD
jgi:hypothetical protein